MSEIKKPEYKREFIWFCYGMALFQVVHYYFWDHQENIGILFGAMMWFIIGKAALIIRCIFIGQLFLNKELEEIKKRIG